ncbi:hypothetical protein LCGC14_1071450 [marine sediment metagenome]|uniref:Retropepsin-like aspartic endopeptidase domain-containing protein n=2 Tax=root TaxID=1 RepID=A0A0F9QNY2_9ZZZZ
MSDMNETQRNEEVETTVGWREWLSLPQLGIERIKAKVDTGARTSAIHAFSVDEFKRDDDLWVKFCLHPNQGDTDTIQWCEALVIDQRNVTDSGGHTEKRYVIHTDIHLGHKCWPAEITLTNRDNMLFRMLLGRTAMTAGNLIVNPAMSFMAGQTVLEKNEHSQTEFFDGESQ